MAPSLAQLSRLPPKTAVTAAATVLVGAGFYSSSKECDRRRSTTSTSVHLPRGRAHIDTKHYALLPPRPSWSSLGITRCEAPAADVKLENKQEATNKPKSSDPTDYAGGAGHLGTSASQDEGLVC
jgi:hypothetical protein